MNFCNTPLTVNISFEGIAIKLEKITKPDYYVVSKQGDHYALDRKQIIEF
jgi:hypothetical protein